MNRPKYKKLYYREKHLKNCWKSLHKSILNGLEQYLDVKITEEIKPDPYHFRNIRYIKLCNKKGKDMVIAMVDETEEDNYDL